MNKYLACWANPDFLIIIIPFILIVVIALFLEYKYLDERKKNKKYHDFLMYTNNPPIAPLKPISVNQKTGGGNPTLELVPTMIIKLSRNQKQIKPILDLILLSLIGTVFVLKTIERKKRTK